MLKAKMYPHARGFSITELLIVIVVVTVLIGIAGATISILRENGRIKITNSEVQTLFFFLDRFRKSSQASALIVTPLSTITSHTLPTLAAGTSVPDFETASGIATGINENNPWGNPYLIELTSKYSKITTVIPGDVSPIGAAEVTFDGTDSTVIYFYNGTLSSKLQRMNTDHAKALLYLEEVR